MKSYDPHAKKFVYNDSIQEIKDAKRQSISDKKQQKLALRNSMIDVKGPALND